MTTVTHAQVPERFNVARYFLDRNLEEGRAGRTALWHQGRACSYGKLAARANRIGNVLLELGVRPEERVLLALGDGIDWVAAWYAVVKIGAISAEVYTFLQPKDYAYYLEYSRARVVIADAVTLDKLRSIRSQCRFLRHLLVAGPAALERDELSLERLIERAAPELRPADTHKDDLALWKFTTGSTGRPKAAVHCHHAPLLSYHAYALGVIGYRPDDLVLPVPKLFFGYARDTTALFPFGVGGAGIVFAERTTPELLFELIDRHRPTILVQVPTMLNAMAEHPEAGRHELGCLRLCISAGEALPPEIYHKWRRTFGVEILDGIGSCELYHIYISNRLGAVQPGSLGSLVPGYQARIVDQDGRDLPDGATGELWVAGESAAWYYHGDRAKTRRTFVGDWVHTGDLFQRDAAGNFYYQGRVDDLLKVGGIWVAPRELEDCLMQHAAVLECAVVGYSASGLELPRAFVVPRERSAAGAALAAELQEFVKQRLAPHKFPRDVVFVADLPRTASGKVDRKALAASPA